LRESSLCAQLETALHDALHRTGASVYFLTRDEVQGALTKRGFLSIDAYDGEVLRLIASDLHADLLVTENLMWNPQIVGLSAEIIDVPKLKSVGKYAGQLEIPVASSDEPLVIKDEESGASLIVFGNKIIKFPSCDSCPDPLHSVGMLKANYEGAVRLMATVTASGMAEQIVVVSRVNPDVAQSAIETARQWHFHPAIGIDGQPFPARMPIEVSYRHP
jgi:TonB family protein